MLNLKDFSNSIAHQLTIFDTPFYPDTLEAAEAMHLPTLEEFKELLDISLDSNDLLIRIAEKKNPMRTQLMRIFKRYVSPDTSVEMLKTKSKIPSIIENFGNRFREISVVREKFDERGINDLVLIALLNEYTSRGDKGYFLTEAFFLWFDEKFDDLTLTGPVRAGKDVILSKVITGFEEHIPADFIIKDGKEVKVVGFARYDSDRGGSQEDDRIKGNKNNAVEILKYNEKFNKNIKILFLNDGPGLLLGSMWKDYVNLEEMSPELIKVVTLKMLDERVDKEWIVY
ncbi:hypothetical protein CW743_09060 [Staphylococcus shinii]|uniref:hypothetical protein n=1 Tax=Staphylococcus shinii TaxID=2912228 RepID=UPI000C32799F|nr:hypothetical protein [Staphylococcus shinii]PKI12188.1 hypothetical protein CW743_09060 [Staphylococcus shinii]